MPTLLTSQEEFDKCKTLHLVTLECSLCSSSFKRRKKDYLESVRSSKNDLNFCGNVCRGMSRSKVIDISCPNCLCVFAIQSHRIKMRNFCSQTCSATYNNKHKTHGTRRSKLEKWLEEQLTCLYPNLEIHFNRKDAIGSELDIYIPSLKLAFELNGIFHYEPIYGQPKLDQIQVNDVSKTKLCHKHQIDLCVIDTSHQTYFKPKTSQVFLDIITSIINER